MKALTAGLFLLVAGCMRQGEVTVQDSEQRVVSLAPSITEVVCAVGGDDLLVGRTSACDHPSNVVEAVPVIGGFGAPSLELLAKARPTLILENDLADETLGARIDAMGLRRVRVKCTRLADIPVSIQTVGELLDCEPRAAELAEQLAGEIEVLREESDAVEQRPRVYVEIWGDPLTTVGKKSFVSDLVTLAGGENIGNDTDKPYFQVSPEWVVSKDPEVILCMYMSRGVPASQAVKTRTGWGQVSAVRQDRIYDDLPDDRILRPGPRVLEGVAALRRCIRPATAQDATETSRNE